MRVHYNQFDSHEQAGCVSWLPPFGHNDVEMKMKMKMKIANAGHYTHDA